MIRLIPKLCLLVDAILKECFFPFPFLYVIVNVKKCNRFLCVNLVSCYPDEFIYQLKWLLSEKAMAPRSSTLAWKIPWAEEPGRLPSMGLLRVGHDWATSLSLFTFTHWRRKWQPTPVFLPGESQGRGRLVGYHLWGRTELDMTEAT